MTEKRLNLLLRYLKLSIIRAFTVRLLSRTIYSIPPPAANNGQKRSTRWGFEAYDVLTIQAFDRQSWTSRRS